MSWAYHVAGDAQVSLRRLELWLQEAVLDQMDLLCEEAEDRFFDPSRPETFTERHHSIQLTLSANRETRVLWLLEVTHDPPPRE